MNEVFAYTQCTIVQQHTIPVIRQRFDVFGKAKTGTGKTLAFLIPSVDRLLHDTATQGRGIRVLIISPTRELASQIANEAVQLCKFTQLNVVCVVGGTSLPKDEKNLKVSPHSNSQFSNAKAGQHV